MEAFRPQYEIAYKKMQEDFLSSFRGGIPKTPRIALKDELNRIRIEDSFKRIANTVRENLDKMELQKNNRSGSEMIKEKGIIGNVELEVAYITKEYTIGRRVIAGSSYQMYDRENRCATIDGKLYRNVTKMVLHTENNQQYRVLIEDMEATVEKTDTRAKYVETATRISNLELRLKVGFISKCEYDEKLRIENRLLSKYDATPQHRMKWNDLDEVER